MANVNLKDATKELVGEATKPRIPLAVDGVDTLEGILRKMTEIIGLTVALVLIIAQFIAGLQVSALPEGLAILSVDDIATVV